MPLNRDFWCGRRVLVTGDTGFKGAWIVAWLNTLGSSVSGFSLPQTNSRALSCLLPGPSWSFDGDIRDAAAVTAAFDAARPQVVLHMAAQPLVRQGYASPRETLSVNIDGTVVVLDAARRTAGVQIVIVVTSDKVYRPGRGSPHAEDDVLGGNDPYSASKACAELVVQMYAASYFDAIGVPVATVRAGNVIGGGDWSTDRLVPDCARAYEAGVPVKLRYPDAIRPWQHVLEPLAGYLLLAEALSESPQTAPRAVNFGPRGQGVTVSEIVDRLSSHWRGRPGWISTAADHPPETPVLRVSSARAEESLGWRPRLDIATAVDWTAEWYSAEREGDDVAAVVSRQIAAYEKGDG